MKSEERTSEPSLETVNSARSLGDRDKTVEIYARHNHLAPRLLPCPARSTLHLRFAFLALPLAGIWRRASVAGMIVPR
jgi:hypothetical protein